jgi:hypothetical protein
LTSKYTYKMANGQPLAIISATSSNFQELEKLLNVSSGQGKRGPLPRTDGTYSVQRSP